MGIDRGSIYYDDLTSIYNKRFFLNIKKHTQLKKIDFIFFDIDDFKYINDVYGHYAGDIVIKEIGEILSNYFLPNNYPIRFGGDEFIIIMEHKSKQEIEILIERLKDTINSRIINHDKSNISITCSFGITTGNIKYIDKLMKEADYALYASKENGKNCYTFYNKDIKKLNYIPFPIIRKISLAMSKNRTILLKGHFKSGKKFIVNILQKKYRDYKFIDLDNSTINNADEKKLFVYYNPVLTINSTEKNRDLYYIKKNKNTDVFILKNFQKSDLQGIFRLYNKEYSLLSINYLDLISSGNVNIIQNYMNSKENFTLFNFEDMQELVSLFPKQILDSLMEINKLGLRFDKNDIKKANISKDTIKYLLDLLFIESKNNEYAYTLPSIFFYIRFRYNIESMVKKYDYILDYMDNIRTFSSLNKIQKLDVIKKLFYYGDVYLAHQLLETFSAGDDKYWEMKCKIALEQNRFVEFKDFLKNIYDNAIIKTLWAFYYYKIGEYTFSDEINTEIRIINTGIKIRNNEINGIVRAIEELLKEKLTIREKITLLSMAGMYYKKINDYKSALYFYSKAKALCLKNHYIGDYGKILMNIGLTLKDLNQFSKAMSIVKNALLIFQISNMKSSIISGKWNLAIIYSNIGDYNKAIGLYSELLTDTSYIENYIYRGNILHNLSESYMRMDYIDDAEIMNNRAIEVYGKSNRKIPVYMLILQNMIMLLKYDKIKKLNIDSGMDFIDKNDIILIKKLKHIRNCFDINRIVNELIKNKELNEIYIDESLFFIILYMKRRRINCKKIFSILNKRLKSKNRILRKKNLQKIMEE